MSRFYPFIYHLVHLRGSYRKLTRRDGRWEPVTSHVAITDDGQLMSNVLVHGNAADVKYYTNQRLSGNVDSVQYYALEDPIHVVKQ